MFLISPSQLYFGQQQVSRQSINTALGTSVCWLLHWKCTELLAG